MCCLEELYGFWVRPSFYFSTLGTFLNSVPSEAMICISSKYFLYFLILSLYINKVFQSNQQRPDVLHSF